MGTRKLLVEVVGDSRSLERAFSRSSTATTRFGVDVDTTAAKVDKSFTRMQRVMAGGFIGGAAVTAGIAGLRSIIDAAAEQEQVLGQTQVALESAGLSWEKYGQRIQKAVGEQSRLGFDDEALMRSFSLFVRQSGSVEEALRRNAIATNLARGRFLDLEQAAALVNKAALGQAGALRRVGIDAAKGATGIELLAQLEREFAGAADKASTSATGATDRLSVSVENLQESLGNALLPVVAETAGNLADAADAATLLANKLTALGDVKVPPIEIPIVGVEVPGTGTDVGDIFSKVGGLAVTAQFLGPTGLIVTQVLKALRDEKPPDITREAQAAIDESLDGILTDLEQARDAAVAKATPRAKAFGEKGYKNVANELGDSLRRQFDAMMDAFSLDFDQARVTPGAADELRVLDQQEAAVKARIASQGRTTALERQLFQVQQDRAQVLAGLADQRAQAAQDAADRARKAAEAARRAREQAAAERQEDQFRALGLDAEGDKPTPTVSNLRKQLSQLSERLVDEGEMTPKIRGQLNRISKVLRGAAGKVTDDTRETIRDMFGDIRQAFGEESGKDLVPNIRAVTLTDKILNALGFGQELEALAQLGVDTRHGPRGRNATTVSGASAVNLYGPVTVVADDPDAFLRQLQKKAGRTTATSRGRFPGKSMGLA